MIHDNSNYCREQELLLIKAQLETNKQAVLQDLKTELREEERWELDQAVKKPPVFDDDCPELTEVQLAQFRRVSKETRPDIRMYRLRYDTNEGHHK